ncbi:MAG TPA: hypothetical protein VF120_13325 [Ktedonobacterales bacterium]
MAYTNEDRARERLQRARSFLEKAHALMLQDDLVYRSALEDAVSAIKNNLQGYLLQRIVLMPPGSAPIPWQEAVAGNRMPELLRACSEAGLDLRGLDREIRKLNDERNSRTHDDPLRRVDTTQARQAVDLALLLHRRVQDALKSFGARTAVPSVNLATRLPAPELAKVGLGRGVVAAARTTSSSGIAASNGSSVAAAGAMPGAAVASTSPSVSPSASGVRASAASVELKDGGEPGDDDPLSDEDTAERAAVQSAVRRRWTQKVVVQGGRVAAFLVVGAAVGILLTLLASGAQLFTPRSSVPRAALTATASILPPNAFISAGTLLVGAPDCKSGHPTMQLRNQGTTPTSFSVGSPDNASVTFTDAATTTPAQTLFGSVAPNNATDVLTLATPAGATAHFHVVVTAPGGSVELVAASC